MFHLQHILGFVIPILWSDWLDEIIQPWRHNLLQRLGPSAFYSDWHYTDGWGKEFQFQPDHWYITTWLLDFYSALSSWLEATHVSYCIIGKEGFFFYRVFSFTRNCMVWMYLVMIYSATCHLLCTIIGFLMSGFIMVVSQISSSQTFFIKSETVKVCCSL